MSRTLVIVLCFLNLRVIRLIPFHVSVTESGASTETEHDQSNESSSLEEKSMNLTEGIALHERSLSRNKGFFFS